MREQEVMLKSYRKEIEVITLTMDVPYYEPNDERRNWFPKYEDVLLKLFNNKRENDEILEIRNYYDSNKISIDVNLTDYLVGSESPREETIEHLVDWFKCGCDVASKDIQQYIHKGYVYEVPDYEIPTDEDNFVKVVW